MISYRRRLVAVSLVSSCWACGSGPRDSGPTAEPAGAAGTRSKAPIIVLRGFDMPFVARPPDGPENDVTRSHGTLRFDVIAPGRAAASTRSAETGSGIMVQCSGTAGDRCDCIPVAAPAAVASTSGGTTLSCAHPFDGAPEGFHTLVIDAIADGSTCDGTSSPCSSASVSWFVDATPPGVTFAPGPSACTTSGGSLPVTLATGTVAFTASDELGFAGASCTLYAVVDGTNVPVAAGADCTDGTFEYSSLPDGLYRLEVQAVDLVANAVIAAFDWVADGTPPAVVFVSPADEAPQDIVAPDLSPTGTFATVADPSDQRPRFECSVDGVAQDCSPGTGYDIGNLAEGFHTVRIAGTDCPGNVRVAGPIAFAADRNPPLVGATVLPGPAGRPGGVDVEVALEDAITNVQSMPCRLDGD